MKWSRSHKEAAATGETACKAEIDVASQYTVQLRGGDQRRLTVRGLIHALEHTLESLRGLDPELPAEWEAVRVRLVPPFAFTFENPQANGSISRRLGNIRKILPRKVEQQPQITEREVDSVREIASLLDEGFDSVRITSKGQPTVAVTKAVATAVETIGKTLATDAYHELTMVRGFLDQITFPEVGGKKFRITEPLAGRTILCSFDASLLNRVKESLHSRVEIYGRGRFNRAGSITSIEVEQLRRLAGDLPSIKLAAPVDLTNGVDSAEYLERVRGGG